MFTGIILEIGTVKSVEQKSGKTYFRISCSTIQKGLKIGDSVACNGICLTIIEFDAGMIKAEAMNETLHKTNAGLWKNGSKINLETAMVFGGRIDGHIVQGHVDRTAELLSRSYTGDTLYLEIALHPEDRKLVVPQGSVCLNGVSLTIAKLQSDSFSVAIIGHTLESTNFTGLKVHDAINIEYDILGKYVVRYFEKSKLTEGWLLENGF